MVRYGTGALAKKEKLVKINDRLSLGISWHKEEDDDEDEKDEEDDEEEDDEEESYIILKYLKLNRYFLAIKYLLFD